MTNSIKTWLLFGALTMLFVLLGNLIAGRQGMVVAFLFALGMNFFSYWFSDKIVLAMYGAREVGPDQYPELYNMVRNLAQAAGLPMPRIYIIPQDSPNAFATGRNPEHAAVAVTEGLLHLMNRDELMGVLAHELGHVKNRDILIGTIAATMAGAIMMLADMFRWAAIFGGAQRDEEEGGSPIGLIGGIALAIIAPIAAMLIQMAISRSREYLADSTGARIANSPLGLANALRKLGAYSQRLPLEAKPSTAHMFIVNPLSGGGLLSLFSTHPPLEARIQRLEEMAMKGAY